MRPLLRFLLRLLPMLALGLTLAPALPARAQDAPVVTGLAALPPDLAERVAARPDRFRDLALGAVFGHGQGGALTQVDLDRMDAIDRAFRRARALAPLLEADLNNDGALSGEEAAARAARLGADARARLMLAQIAADTDRDGTADAAELRAMAEGEAARAAQTNDAAVLSRLMVFDADADGRLTVDEVEAAVTAMGAG